MQPSERIYRGVFGVTLAALAVFAIYQLIQGNWSDLFVTVQAIVISSIPFFLEKKFSIHTPYALRTAFIFFMVSTMILGEIGDFYNTFLWWDLLWHGLSSAGITLIGFILVTITYRSKDLKAYPFLTSFLVFSFAMCAAVIWEVYEFIIDLTLQTDSPMQPSNFDTMTDLIIAIVGSLVICVYGYYYLQRQFAKTMIDKVIEEGILENQ